MTDTPTDRKGRPLHKAVLQWAEEARAEKMSRREFPALATAFGASTATAYGLLGLGAPPAMAQDGKQGGVLNVSMSVRRVVDPRTFDWSEMGNVARQFCEPLVRYTRDSTFVPWLLDSQLNEATRTFINDSTRNRFDTENGIAYLSKIFKWFAEDFETAAGSVQSYLATFVEDDAAAATLAAKKNYITNVYGYLRR